MAALLVKAERCCQGEYHSKKTIVLNCFKPQLGKRTLGRRNMYHFYASSCDHMEWNDLRKDKIQATPLNTSFQSSVRDLVWGRRKFYRSIRSRCCSSFAFPAQTEAPFYEEWWFLLVMALSSLILILLVVFALVLHGQSKKYKNCSTGKTTALHCTHALKIFGN